MNRLTIGVLLAGSAAMAAIAWKTTSNKPIQVTIAVVERGDVRSTVANTRAGTVNTCNRARMSPIVSGQIAALPVSEGDAVEAGEVLLELWNDDVRAQLLLVEKELEFANARVDEACSASKVASREAERIERLYDQGLVSEESADSVFGQEQATEAACRAMRSMVDVSLANIQLRKSQLERTILRAPFAGTVAQINGEIGEIVTPSPVGEATLPAVDLVDTSCTFVTAPIDEVDASGIRAGMMATISLDAFPGKSFPATIRRAPYVVDQQTQARTVDIEAEFSEASSHLLPGYSADVEVLIEVHENVLFVPTQAIVNRDRVFILANDGVLEERIIEAGIRNWQVTEVLDGLSESERVVLSVEREGVIAGVSATAEDESQPSS